MQLQIDATTTQALPDDESLLRGTRAQAWSSQTDMKILHVIHSIDPRSGGPSNALRELIAAQRRSGLTVSLLSTTAQASEPWSERDDFCRRMSHEPTFTGMELYLGRSYGRRRPWNRFGYTPASVRWLKRQCRTTAVRPDVIHIHGVYSHLTQATAAIASQLGIPYVVRPAGSFDPVAITLRSAWIKRLFIRMRLRGQLHRAAFVHTTSTDEATSIRSGFPEAQVRVVPHGVSVPDALSSAARSAWYSRFPQLEGKRQLLFMSRLHRKKQPELLIRALPALRREFPDLMLVLAGPDAGHREAMEIEVRQAGVENSVVFAGFLQGDMKHAAFTEAVAFALPSKHENYAFAVVEAMAHGKPVLVSPHVATHEFVDEADAGVTVPDTADDVLAGLVSLLRQDSAAMGARGREFVREHLSWESVEQRLREHYHSALATRAEFLGALPNAHETSELLRATAANDR